MFDFFFDEKIIWEMSLEIDERIGVVNYSSKHNANSQYWYKYCFNQVMQFTTGLYLECLLSFFYT